MRRAALTVVLLLLPLYAMSGDVYRTVDAQGHVEYTDTPTPGSELVHVADGHVASQPAPAKPDGAKRADEQLSQESAQRAMQSDLTQARTEQCKKATEAYQQSIRARRIYKTDDDGSKEYLSDADADQIRLNNRLEMESACKDSQ
jgi:Domain of unknown function (DUF4124)